jgi:hypothetical protein
MAACPTCGRPLSFSNPCGCLPHAASAGAGAAATSPRTSAGTGGPVEIPRIASLPRAERFDATIVGVRSGPAVPSDRPAWSRVLGILGVIPLALFAAFAIALGLALRIVMGRSGGGRGGALSKLHHGSALLDRVRGGDRDGVTILELDTDSGHQVGRLLTGSAQVPLQPGDRVTVAASGRSQGAMRIRRVESQVAGVVAAPAPVGGMTIAGALFVLFVLATLLSQGGS